MYWYFHPALWCNGNTAPFGGVIHGSNPCGAASFRTFPLGPQKSLTRWGGSGAWLRGEQLNAASRPLHAMRYGYAYRRFLLGFVPGFASAFAVLHGSRSGGRLGSIGGEEKELNCDTGNADYCDNNKIFHRIG